MATGDSLFRHVSIWFVFGFGRTCSGNRVVSKYVFIALGWLLLVEVYPGFQPSTRADIPGWGALLLVYATILIPVLFSVMVGINILVWTKLRINHIFIFGECGTTSTTSQSLTPRVVGLDVKSKIDYQQYTEVSRLLAW